MNVKSFFKNIDAKARPSLVIIMLVVVALMGFLIVNKDTTTRVKGAYTDYTYYKTITFESDYVNDTLNEFPVLIHEDTGDLQGKVLDDGSDISFWNSSRTAQLDHEIEYYNGATGELYAWVKIPNMFYDSDTVIYMYYGDSDGGYSVGNNPTTVWSNGYNGVYHLDEESGHCLDSTANDEDATGEGGISYSQTGISNSSVLLVGSDANGDDGYVNIPKSVLSNADAEDGLTIECWANWVTLTASGQLFNMLGDTNIPGGIIQANNTLAYFQKDDGGTYRLLYSDATVTTGTWFYNVYSFDGDNMRSYVDTTGTLHTGSDAHSMHDADSSNHIGANEINRWGPNAYIDEFRVSSVVRNSSWIDTTYHSTVTSGFTTFGSEVAGESPSTYTLNGESSPYGVTWSGDAGKSVYCNASGTNNEWLEINMTINSTDNVTEVRVYCDDLNDTGAYINASNISLYVSSDNSSYGLMDTFSDSGSNISINTSTWNSGTMGNNPFEGEGLTDKTESIWIIFRLAIPSGSPSDTFTTATTTSWKIYIGTV